MGKHGRFDEGPLFGHGSCLVHTPLNPVLCHTDPLTPVSGSQAGWCSRPNFRGALSIFFRKILQKEINKIN